MALYFHLSSLCTHARISPKFTPQEPRAQIAKRKNVVHVDLQATTPVIDTSLTRRSANYRPNFWDHNYLLSLTSEYSDDTYKEKAKKLKEDVKQLLNDAVGSAQILDVVDAIQRLGVGYHYKVEIKRALNNAFINCGQWFDDDLYTTALRFRLLRQHGYNVSLDVFDQFRDENGNLLTCFCEDVKGILSLYDATYFGLEGEDFMDEARAFTRKHLKDLKENINPTLAKKVAHSLELAVHWRTSRLESRWYIDIYGSEENMIPILLDLAKLDYNIVQATHQGEVRRLTRRWVDFGLYKKEFFRDRILEHYYWTLGMVHEPEYGSFRITGGLVIQLITMIDDMYDVYGSLDELVLFTDAVERWDICAMEQLPHYMKVCYMALLKTNTEISYEILNEQGFDVASNLKKAWVDLCKAYLLEAKWFHEGYTPPLEEYIGNAWMSVASPLMLVNCYVLTAGEITKDALDCIESMPSLVYNSGMLLRLVDDLGTATDELARGDVSKSIQCYMHEASVSEEVARKHIRYLINDSWKKMNKALREHYPFSEPFISAAPNLGRQAHVMYLYRDGHGIPDFETKDDLKSLLVEPIPL